MKLVVLVVLAFIAGIALGRFDHARDDRRHSLAVNALVLTVNEHPDHAQLWRSFKATLAYARARE
jgi:hypothetical protein